MSHGFLGYDGSTFMLDFVVTALVLIVPALLVSLYLVKVQRNYTAHRNLQLALAGVLLVTVIAFEIDIRAHGGWRAIVDTRTVPLSAERLETVRQTLSVHLVFAISTPLLWGRRLRWLSSGCHGRPLRVSTAGSTKRWAGCR